MTPTEAAALLTMASAFDNRKVTTEAAQAWASTLPTTRLDDARDALQRHFRESDDWLMPKHITANVKRLRRERMEAYGTLPDPPPSVDPDDTDALIRWQRDVTRRIGDGETPDRAMPGTRSLDMAALAELMPRPARGEAVHEHAATARAAIVRAKPPTPDQGVPQRAAEEA